MDASDLVTFDTGGPKIDGILVEQLKGAKAVVAIVDRTRGPVLKTVPAAALSERDAEGPDDTALRLLIRRMPAASRGSTKSAAGSQATHDGHTRTAMHRTTGK